MRRDALLAAFVVAVLPFVVAIAATAVLRHVPLYLPGGPGMVVVEDQCWSTVLVWQRSPPGAGKGDRSDRARSLDAW